MSANQQPRAQVSEHSYMVDEDAISLAISIVKAAGKMCNTSSQNTYDEACIAGQVPAADGEINASIQVLLSLPSVSQLSTSFCLDDISTVILLLAIVAEQYPKYHPTYYQALQSQVPADATDFEYWRDMGSGYPSLACLSAMVCPSLDAYQGYVGQLHTGHPLLYWELLVFEQSVGPILHRPVRVHSAVIDHFCEAANVVDAPASTDESACLFRIGDHDPAWLGACADVSGLHHSVDTESMSMQPMDAIQVYGGSSYERLEQCLNIARLCQQCVYELRTERCWAFERPLQQLKLLLRFISLKQAMLYWPDGLSLLNESPPVAELIADWLNTGPSHRLCFSSDSYQSWPLVVAHFQLQTRALTAAATPQQTKRYWMQLTEAYLGRHAKLNWLPNTQRSWLNSVIKNLSCRQSLLQLCLFLREYCEAHYAAHTSAERDELGLSMNVFRTRVGECVSLSTSQAHTLDGAFSLVNQADIGVHTMEAGWTLDDLVLPEVLHTQLLSLAHAVRSRATNTNVLALLYGLPGTGKTIAVQALANYLGLTLCRIDLATISSKWVGETEKNLEQLFSYAEHNHCVLFFDEADALFGKRTVVDGHQDKHSNMSAGFLLQRIERFNGIALLATNYKDNIDPAFLRRMHYSLFFPQPDAAQRLLLWQREFSKYGGLEERVGLQHLDLQHIAQKYIFSGAEIRNICYRVNTHFATHDESAHISNKIVLREISQEHKKQHKSHTEDEFLSHWRGSRDYLAQVNNTAIDNR